jgi:hypothetical protein
LVFFHYCSIAFPVLAVLRYRHHRIAGLSFAGFILGNPESSKQAGPDGFPSKGELV